MRPYLLFVMLLLFAAVVNAQVNAPTKYIFKFSVTSGSGDAEDASTRFTLHYADGTTETLTGPAVGVGSTSWVNENFYVTKKISSVDFKRVEHQRFNDPGGLNANCYMESTGTVQTTNGDYYKTNNMSLTNVLPGSSAINCSEAMFTDIYVRVRITPAIMIENLDRTDPTQSIYCENQQVRLNVSYHGGDQNEVYWQYRTDNGNFKYITTIPRARTLVFTLRDLFGDDYATYLNRNIEFRAVGAQRFNGVNEGVTSAADGSNILKYSFSPATPTPVSVIATDPKCAEDSAKGIVIKFNRALLPGEELTSITLNKLTGAVNPFDQVASPTLSADNIFEWTNVRSLPVDSYWINVEGKLNGTKPLCDVNSYGFRVKAPLPVTFTIADKQDVSCFGAANGSITVNATGGKGTYAYSKDGGITWQSSNVFSGLVNGDYTVMVKDINDCISKLPETVTINQPVSSLSASVVSFIDPKGANSNDGRVIITVNGGSFPYTYSWTNGSTTQNITNAGGGTHTVTVTDARGCIATASVGLVAPDPIIMTFNETSISCNGVADGSIQSTVSGGVKPYSYSWSNAATTTTIGQLPAATYTLTITDANGIVASQPYVLKQPDILTLGATSIAVSCYGLSDGSITTTVNGGTSPYTYSWGTLTGLKAGEYPLQVTDAHGCIVSATPVVASPDSLAVNGVITTPTRFGSTDGAVRTGVTGGTTPYVYNWNIGSTADRITGLGEGNYTLTVTDAHHCITLDSFNVLQPDPLTMDVLLDAAVLCHGLSSGVLTAYVKGGVQPYRYEWSGGRDTRSINGLPAGTYHVKVTDNSGVEKSGSYTITEPPLMELSLTATQVSCGGITDGTVTSLTTGGVTPYSYRWNTGDSSADIRGLNGGMYTVHVTDANGCILSASEYVTAPGALAVSAVIKEPTCFGYSDGAIAAQVTGGRLPYTYLWNTNDNTAGLKDVPAGIYTLHLTDSSGCLIVGKYLLTEPDQLKVYLGDDRTLCVGQSLELNATIPGGVSYSWTGNNGFSATTPLVTLSDKGSYTVVSTDGKGCIATDDVSIERDDREIDANFIVSSQCYTGESVIAVNISQPVADNVKWWLPSLVDVLSRDDNVVELLFKKAGSYEMLLTTYRGNCETTTRRSITVTDPVELPDIATFHNSLFKRLVLRPNPNNGVFSLDLETVEDIVVSYRLLDIQRNRIVHDEKGQLLKGITNNVSFNIPGLPAGVYVLLVESVKDKKALKVIIL